MAKKRLTFSDEFRQAVDNCGLTRYRLAKLLGVSEALLSRFMAGKCFLGQGNIDALAELLDLRVAAGKRHKPKG